LVRLDALVRVDPVVRPREPSRIIAVVNSLAGGEVQGPVNILTGSIANVAADVAWTHLQVTVVRVAVSQKSLQQSNKIQKIIKT
jgi:hypothetical protein